MRHEELDYESPKPPDDRQGWIGCAVLAGIVVGGYIAVIVLYRWRMRGF
jgi:hypothetical protein